MASALGLSLWPLWLREWRHHPGRQSVALAAVALGVALAWSVHLINGSALSEFSHAVRTVSGQPDLTVRGQREGFDDALFDRLASDPAVAMATPVLEVESLMSTAAHAEPRPPGPASSPRPAQAREPSGGDRRQTVRILGVDPLSIAFTAPELLPRLREGSGRLAALEPEHAFVNAQARAWLSSPGTGQVALQAGSQWQTFRVVGDVAAGGPPLVVVDIDAAQRRFAMVGRLTRIDLRLRPGQDAAHWAARQSWPAGVQVGRADDEQRRASQISRAYRVNLSVLALVALFVGTFLVYSVQSLSVAQRQPQLALLGVLGMTRRERRRLVLVECGLIGVGGSALGLLLGTLMAAAALQFLSADLGGGFFAGQRPALRVDPLAAAGHALLGTVAALVGGWLPARSAEKLQPAQALKGLNLGGPPPGRTRWGLALLLLGSGLAFLPPVLGLPLAAYAAVAALLAGGVAVVPWLVDRVVAAWHTPRHPHLLLALRRARFNRETASAVVAGVVASLALSVALTVMVASFREAVSQWLHHMLPADLYARTAPTSAAAGQAWLDPGFADRAARVAGVMRVEASRSRPLQLAIDQPAVTLIARRLDDPATRLPLVEGPWPAGDARPGVFVSEAVVARYGARPGSAIRLPLAGQDIEARVDGVWRDFARQFGSIAIDSRDYRRLTGDERVNDLALWLQPGADRTAVQRELQQLLPDPRMLEFAATPELRQVSLQIFDRSFAVTRYLQAIAIAVGLFGVMASLSAQILARRKEFGLLRHLGLTRSEVVRLVTLESMAWLAAGAAVGLAVGLAVSGVLVWVVNPQSFHWSMDLMLPADSLAALVALVLASGTLAAALSSRAAGRADAVAAVREDW